MKKILLTFLISLLFLPACDIFAEVYQSACEGAGATWSSGVCTCPKSSNGISQTWSTLDNACECVGQYTKVGTECKIITSSTGSTVGGQSEASRCLSAKCEVPKNTFGSTVAPTYNYSTGLCSCPPGYSSTSVDYFNKTVTDPNFDASSGVTGTGSSGSTSSGSSGSSSVSYNSYTSGNSGGSTTITMPTVTSTGTLTNPITSTSFAALLDNVIDWILNIALVLAPLIIVYGGFLYMTAAGDTNKVSQGKNVVLYAVIGFILALMAKSLIGIFAGLVVK
jgi:hypothetical protein